MERVTSGQRRLDVVLGGGLPPNTINVIAGVPGSGKTMLAQQFFFANATAERPGVYLSTVSEPMDKVIRFGQSLSFFETGAIGRTVFYEDLGLALSDDGLDGVAARIAEIVRERRPGVIVVDSFKALSEFAESPAAYRRFLHEVAGLLTATATTAFWVGEYTAADLYSSPESAVADSLILLSSDVAGRRASRSLEILKLRGSSFQSGAHAYRLSEGGLEVFPRLADTDHHTQYVIEPRRFSSGISAVDAVLTDGFWEGSSTLCAGPSGSGKTLMGLHFIFNGLLSGEPGLIATMQENPSQLERIVNGFGWSLAASGTHLMYQSPVDLYVDQWVYELLDRVEETGAKRVLIDSLSDLQHASDDDVVFREYVYSLTQRLARRGVSVFMTTETSELFTTTFLSEFGATHFSDNIVLLQYYLENATVGRSLTVLKTRASNHDPGVHPFSITTDGIVLLEAALAEFD